MNVTISYGKDTIKIPQMKHSMYYISRIRVSLSKIATAENLYECNVRLEVNLYISNDT